MWAKQSCCKLLRLRRYCTHSLMKPLFVENSVNTESHIPEPEYNEDFLCNPLNRDTIFHNIQLRKGVGDIDKVLELSKKPELRAELLNEISKIPNCTHPEVLKYGDEPLVIKECGEKFEYDFTPVEFSQLAEKLKLLRTANLGPVAGQRSYILLGDLAQLEAALVQYTVEKLLLCGFKLVSVPDIIPTKIIERCGLIVDGERTLVYNLDPSYGQNYSLSGTAEMALAYKLMNNVLSHEELPLKLAAVSRCFRAETSKIAEEKGIYRVHQFTKVEMFVCSEQDKSAEEFTKIQDIQEDLFSTLNLHFKVIDMPSHDLGAPAYRKIDMEGWMPGRQLYGELSSCSNCTDYQSRRLNIKYKTKDGRLLHVHTLNGTACAIPRMLIAFCETYQTRHGRITVPDVLRPHMQGISLIRKQPVASMRVYKYKQKSL